MQGFDRFYGYNCQRNAHTYYPTWLYDNEVKVELDGKTYATMDLAKEAGVATLNYGSVIDATIKFIVVAFVLFMVIKDCLD